MKLLNELVDEIYVSTGKKKNNLLYNTHKNAYVCVLYDTENWMDLFLVHSIGLVTWFIQFNWPHTEKKTQ